MNIVLLLLIDRLGRFGSTENFCNFAKDFLRVIFFLTFSNEYEIRVYVHYIVKTKKLIIIKVKKMQFFLFQNLCTILFAIASASFL